MQLDEFYDETKLPLIFNQHCLKLEDKNSFQIYDLFQKPTHLIMSDSESDNEEFTIGNDLVVTKYKMAGDIANR